MLIKKFAYYGIRRVASSFLESYLKNRYRYVQFKEDKSTNRSIRCGVPEGSILGPLLFILYINDMYKVSKLLHFIIFADDTRMSHKKKITFANLAKDTQSTFAKSKSPSLKQSVPGLNDINTK